MLGMGVLKTDCGPAESSCGIRNPRVGGVLCCRGLTLSSMGVLTPLLGVSHRCGLPASCQPWGCISSCRVLAPRSTSWHRGRSSRVALLSLRWWEGGGELVWVCRRWRGFLGSQLWCGGVEETGHDRSRVPSCDAALGPPISWVPPCGSPPQMPPPTPIDTAHIPLERGGARCGLHSAVGSELGQ